MRFLCRRAAVMCVRVCVCWVSFGPALAWSGPDLPPNYLATPHTTTCRSQLDMSSPPPPTPLPTDPPSEPANTPASPESRVSRCTGCVARRYVMRKLGEGAGGRGGVGAVLHQRPSVRVVRWKVLQTNFHGTRMFGAHVHRTTASFLPIF